MLTTLITGSPRGLGDDPELKVGRSGTKGRRVHEFLKTCTCSLKQQQCIFDIV